MTNPFKKGSTQHIDFETMSDLKWHCTKCELKSGQAKTWQVDRDENEIQLVNNEKGLYYNKQKQKLGQFFTTNVDYILSGFENFIYNKNITDPFCGNQDLLKWAIKNKAKSIKGYDVDERYIDNNLVFLNDSLKNPLEYDFVLTNPPYLYKSKMKNSEIFKGTNNTDLYQLSLEKVMNSNEGIVIVPVNFLSAENAKYIRIKFFDKFSIKYCKYFTQQVFNDTTYNVIAFYYTKKNMNSDKETFILNIQPDNIEKEITIYKEYNWQIGGEFLNLINSQRNILNVKRLLIDDIKDGNNEINVAINHLKDTTKIKVDLKTLNVVKNNIILLKAIDTGRDTGRICLENIKKYNLDCLLSLTSSRNQIFLVFQDKLDIQEQEQIIKLFNKELNEKREQYFSLFMTNFRDNNRKRISFDFVYKLINYIYFNKIKGENNEKQYSLFEAIN